MPKGVKKIDCFCVGGGGGRAHNGYSQPDCYQGGGGGGYTTTKLGASVNPGQQISVVVGSGGFMTNFNSSTGIFYGSADGGISSVGSICSANGGYSGIKWFDDDHNGGMSFGAGGSDGGSGGAPIEAWGWSESDGYHLRAGKDGENGKNYIYYNNFTNTYSTFSGGNGQGTTTRYFGEENGTLYASGGEDYGIKTHGITDNSPNHNTSGAANTGNGSDAAYAGHEFIGGSGICIIRWKS